MTSKIRERLLNGTISFLTAGGAVVLAFALSTGEGNEIRVNQELRDKADLIYVIQHDEALEDDLDTYKADQPVPGFLGHKR